MIWGTLLLLKFQGILCTIFIALIIRIIGLVSTVIIFSLSDGSKRRQNLLFFLIVAFCDEKRVFAEIGIVELNI